MISHNIAYIIMYEIYNNLGDIKLKKLIAFTDSP